jgi:hypothetical protein
MGEWNPYMPARKAPLSHEALEPLIFSIRGHRVMLSTDLAELYAVEPRALVQAVKRNIGRFPEDFMFRLSSDEASVLKSHSVSLKGPGFQASRSQFVILKAGRGVNSRSQIVTLKRGENIKYAPYAFTEQGVAMLSSVLRSKRAVMVNIEIMRAFVRLRQMLGAHAELARKFAALERKYDSQFKAVFDAIRELMTPPPAKKRPIGFGPWEDRR